MDDVWCRGVAATVKFLISVNFKTNEY